MGESLPGGIMSQLDISKVFQRFPRGKSSSIALKSSPKEGLRVSSGISNYCDCVGGIDVVARQMDDAIGEFIESMCSLRVDE